MKKQLLETLENSRAYTISVAEALPGNLYRFKPSGAVWDFGELLNHVAYGIRWCNENYIQSIETEWLPPATKNKKEEIISYLDEEYSLIKNSIEKQALSDETIKGFHAAIDHITHHRGQAVIYLRCNGITPPGYNY